MSYGENLHKGHDSDPKNFFSIHAEESALRKLPQLPRHKKLKRIDLLVIRANKSGTLGSSKPCIHCTLCMYKQLPEKGYILDTIYFSNREGIIEETTLAALLHDKEPHMSRFYKERNMKLR